MANLSFDYNAALKAGKTKQEIIDYLTKSRRTSPKPFIAAGKSDAFIIKTMSKFINQTEPEVTKEGLKTKGILGAVGEFFGSEKLGRGLGYRLAGKEAQQNIASATESGYLRPEEAELLKTGGVSGKEMAGSALQTGLSLAAPFLPIPAVGKGTLGATMKWGAGLGGAFGLATELQQERDFELGNALTSVAIGAALGASVPLVQRGFQKAFQQIKVLPEKAYTQIYRNATDDMRQEMNSKALIELQQTDPKTFQTYLKKGIIRMDGDTAVFNPTTARIALEKGIKGSVEDQANYVIGKTYRLESDARKIVSTYRKPLTIPNKKNYINLLKDYRNEIKLQGGGFLTKETDKATSIIAELTKSKGNTIKAETALDLRRFLDNARNTSSFRMNANLSPKQGGYKVAADFLRNKLAKEVPNMAPLMQDYAFYIDATDSLVNYAMRSGNRSLIGGLDALLSVGGLATGQPALGVGAAALRRAALTPTALTYGAQGLQKGIINPIQQGAAKLQTPALKTAESALRYPVLSEIQRRTQGGGMNQTSSGIR